MTKKILVLVVTAILMYAPIFPAYAAGVSGQLAKRVEDIQKLVQSDPDGFEKVLSPAFLAKVPPDKLSQTLREYFNNGGEVVSVVQVKSISSSAAEYRFFTRTTVFPVKIRISEVSPYLVESLWLGSQFPYFAKPGDAVEALKKFPGKVSFAVWKLGGSAPKVLASYNAEERLAIGSTFKLYILGALLRDISGDKRKWEDVIGLKEAWKSWPSGVLQEWPDGTSVTLNTLAIQMISVSDNTAADHLLYLLDRRAVEAAMVVMGHQASSLNVPFLSTGEMFRLKNTEKSKEYVRQYLAQDGEGRRSFVDGLRAQPRADSLKYTDVPSAIDKVEWFASAADLCRAMDWLRQNSEKGLGANVRPILSVNKGLKWADDKWRFVGYKGGSEPGVINLTWLAKRNDGEWFAVSGGWNDAAAQLDEDKFTEVLQAVIFALE